MKKCISYLVDQYSISKLIQGVNSRREKDIKKITNIILKNLYDNIDRRKLFAQIEEIVEKAAIGLSLLTIGSEVDHIGFEVTKRKDGADYFVFDKNNLVYTIEVKGATTTNSCGSQFSKGKTQVVTTLNKFPDSVQKGWVSLSCFANSNQYVIEIEDKSKESKEVKDLVEQEIIKKKMEKSKILTEAMELKEMNKKNYEEKFNTSAKLDQGLAMYFQKNLDYENAFLHWISSINSFIEAKKYAKALQIVRDIKETYDFNPLYLTEINEIETSIKALIQVNDDTLLSKDFVNKLINFVIKKITNYRKQGIRGKFSIHKIMYFLRELTLDAGKGMDLKFYASRNPTFSTEINEILNDYIKMNFLIQAPDNSLKLSSKAIEMLSHEEELTEMIIKNKFGDEFYYEVISLVNKLKDYSSEEFQELEKELGITSLQYGRPI